ncbi:XRE family transcriptional regulator [Magnetospirillum sp. 64-120]|uniref:XRE family transcriptional regulator n=1 Tax=Magnetospirillum sp. 64-120 TaxID=1895778 RepID=UPI000927CE33|nr:XRE family transcriptional regulator [Magnetospirillum sp. 64-120]OJX74826.1 MAG: DNA-binding protein [Magnetospirillum sp. 64-120]
MTYDEFQRHVGKAGLTLKAFAELVRMNRISLSNLAKKGEVPTHLAVIAALLGEMADKGIDYREVLSRIAIAPKKPRGAGKRGKFGGDKQEELFTEGKAPKRTADKGVPGTH